MWPFEELRCLKNHSARLRISSDSSSGLPDLSAESPSAVSPGSAARDWRSPLTDFLARAGADAGLSCAAAPGAPTIKTRDKSSRTWSKTDLKMDLRSPIDDPPTPENLSSIRPSGWGRKPENGATLMQERHPQQPGGFPDFYPGKDLNNGLRKTKVTVLRGVRGMGVINHFLFTSAMPGRLAS